MPEPFSATGWADDANPSGHVGPLAAVRVQPDLDQAIEGADLVMALRLQLERQQLGFFPSIREYIRRWQVNDSRMARANPGALLMHPGPMNEGIEVDTALAHGERSLIEETGYQRCGHSHGVAIPVGRGVGNCRQLSNAGQRFHHAAPHYRGPGN